VPDRASQATADGYHLAAYGALENGPMAVRFGAALTAGTVNTTRDDIFSGFSETLVARYAARTRQVFAEASYRATFGNLAVEPFAGVAHVALDTDGFAETGGSAALSGDAQHHAMTLASFGARFAVPLPTAGARITALLAWQHRFGDMAPTSALAFDGGTPFTVAGVPRRRDSLRIEAGLDWDIGSRANFSLSYAGNIAAGASDHGARIRFAIHF
jgi:outer membrane autotransporter protein